VTTGFPAILLLDGRLGVVVGGGALGERKVHTLLDAGAKVRCVTDEITPGLRAMADRSEIDLIERPYLRGDLVGAVIAIAATEDEAVNQGVFDEAVAAGMPVNVVDDVPRCTFIAPSIVRRGDLLIAISTGGGSPALAVRIKERLAEEFGNEYEAMLALLGELRNSVTVSDDKEARSRAWYRVVDDAEMWSLVRAGRIGEARDRATKLLLQD
jgi:precorrin-2 dehydrogenase/sirohydrochlorin ferrochelatase